MRIRASPRNEFFLPSTGWKCSVWNQFSLARLPEHLDTQTCYHHGTNIFLLSPFVYFEFSPKVTSLLRQGRFVHNPKIAKPKILQMTNLVSIGAVCFVLVRQRCHKQTNPKPEAEINVCISSTLSTWGLGEGMKLFLKKMAPLP